MQEFEYKSKKKIINFIMVHLMPEGRLLRDMGLVVFIGDFSPLGEERLLAKLLILSPMSLLLGSL